MHNLNEIGYNHILKSSLGSYCISPYVITVEITIDLFRGEKERARRKKRIVDSHATGELIVAIVGILNLTFQSG